VVTPAGGVEEAAKAAQTLPLAGERVADFTTNISVDDYLSGKSLASLSACLFFYKCGLLVGASQGRTKANLL
jgi:hypothetical protein